LASNEGRKKDVSTSSGVNKKKQKIQKRLSALSEVLLEQDEVREMKENQSKVKDDVSLKNVKEEGFMGKLKNLYDEADKMAASQALIMNKELEDLGVLEKITDETGLKVIGKEAAAKLKDKKE
jgi:hypothetical protein